MLKKILTYLSFFLLAVIFTSCTNDTDDEDKLPIDNSMQLVISAPKSPNTRVAIVDGDGVNLPTDKAEQTKDGWAIRSLAVFIANENGQAVAGRELIINDAAPNAGKVIFDLTQTDKAECSDIADDKKILKTTDYTIRGKNLIPPKVGPYKIYAIANYKGNNDIATSVANVIDAMSNTNDAALQANNQAWTALINSTVSSEASHLCDKNTDMILSAIQDIKITVGNKNPYRIKLLRTRARVRITVRNESLRHAVHINSLSFQNFTRTSSSLFPSALVAADATINPQGTNAIIPFDPNAADIPKLDDTNPAASEKTIFDGYILESDGPYYTEFSSKLFRFDIGVTARTGQEAYTKYSQAVVTQVENGGWYMIETGGKVIVPHGNLLNLVDKPDDLTLNSANVNRNQYFWEWTQVGKDSHGKWGNLKSINTSQFITEPSNGDFVTLGSTASKYMYLQNNQFFSWKIWGPWYDINEAYFNIYSDLKWHQQNDMPPATGGGWNFYHIDIKDVPAKGDETISKTLNLSKLQNNQSFNVFEIRRNDFYHIFINVRYNDNLGHFYFEVLPWTDKNLDIEFE